MTKLARSPSPLSFRIRVLVLALVAIAWLATRDSPGDVDVQPGAGPAAAQVVVAGKTSAGRDGRADRADPPDPRDR